MVVVLITVVMLSVILHDVGKVLMLMMAVVNIMVGMVLVV